MIPVLRETDYSKPRLCPRDSCEMEHKIDIDQEEYFIRRYHIWKCPKCDYMTGVEDL